MTIFRPLNITILLVTPVVMIVGWFGFWEDFKKMLDLLADANRWINETAKYPGIFWAAFGLFVGGGVSPPVLRFLTTKLFFKKAKEEFDLEFNNTKEERNWVRVAVNEQYATWRKINGPDRIVDLLQKANVPGTLPLDSHGSLIEWAQTIDTQLSGTDREVWDFVCSLVDKYGADAPQETATKFWDKWGKKMKDGEIKLVDVTPQLISNAQDLKLLTYWEARHISSLGWDAGAGKSGLFYLAHEAERLQGN